MCLPLGGGTDPIHDVADHRVTADLLQIFGRHAVKCGQELGRKGRPAAPARFRSSSASQGMGALPGLVKTERRVSVGWHVDPKA